jgi:tetratricopeptide (TPR) repeat protein
MARECPRNKNKLCWQCCNELRADSKCPDACVYAPKKDENSPFPAFKADSRAEATDVLRLYIDLWVGHTNAQLEQKSPIDYAKENPKALLAWLSGYQYPLHFPVSYLMQKLELPTTFSDAYTDPEACVEAYMNTLIALDWLSLRTHSINTLEHDDLSQRYTELLQEIPTLGKISTYSLIHSGLGEDGISAIVYLELNHRQDWTLLLSNATGTWKVRQNISGSPQAYFVQNKIYTQIAEALGKADDAAAWDLITANLKIYPDSPDLYYYRGIYWQLVKQNDSAAVDFFNAAALDNAWPEPYYHLGALALTKSDFASATQWFIQLTNLQPDNPNAQNNLAACYAGAGDKAKAREIWQKLATQYPDLEIVKLNLEKLEK